MNIDSLADAPTCIISRSREETEIFGKSLAPHLQAGNVVVLSGGLGAGKTQFTKGVAKGLGITEAVTSPTFNLLIVYHAATAPLPLYHFDLYRLESEDELVDIDYAATLESDGVSLIEWGDKFPDAMPVDYLHLSLELLEGESRRMDMRAVGPRSSSLLAAWRKSLAEICGEDAWESC